MKSSKNIVPRLIRLRDAPFYLGMDRNRFNREVRIRLTEIRIGIQGIAFDRLDLDAWVDQYIDSNKRPKQPKGVITWGKNEHQAYAKEKGSGTLTSRSSVNEFAKAVEQAINKKPS